MGRSILLLFAVAITPFANADDLIWVEGEHAEAKDMRRHGWYDSVKKAELSGQEWLSHFGGNQSPVASFRFSAKTGGKHVFWLRANPTGSAMSVNLNGGGWQAVSFDKAE